MAGKTAWPPGRAARAGVQFVRVQIGGKSRKWTLRPAGSDPSPAPFAPPSDEFPTRDGIHGLRVITWQIVRGRLDQHIDHP